MKRTVEKLDCCSVKTMEDNHGASTSQSNTVQALASIEHHAVHLFNTRLTPAVLQAYANKLELLRKCSFYIEVIQHDHPQQLVMQLIDHQRFHSMKQVGNHQVKIQLALLEELLDELNRGRQELQGTLERKGLSSLWFEENAVRKKISRLLQAAAEFEDMSVPGRLHVKHGLFLNVSGIKVPDIKLALSLKKPVVFDRPHCTASSDYAILHWNVIEQEQHMPGEQFEIRYKLLHLTGKGEASQTATMMACASYCAQVNNLMPGSVYEFRVKRVDSWFLVYSLWMDVLLLRTLSEGGEQ